MKSSKLTFDTRQFLANILFYLGIGSWIGAAFFFGFGIAGVVFKHLPSKDLAGTLNGIILDKLSVLLMISGCTALIGSFFARPKAILGINIYYIIPVFISLMIGTTVYNAAYISPRMHVLKGKITSFDTINPIDDVAKAEFRELHKQYSSIMGIGMGLSIITLIAYSVCASLSIETESNLN